MASKVWWKMHGTGWRKDLETTLMVWQTKIVGGVDSFKNMVDKLSIKDAVMPVMDELLEWRRKVENAIDKASHGPIKLANMEDGRLCPAGLGDKQIFGVFPTDCGLFEDGSIF